MWDNTDPSEVGAPRHPVRGLDHVTLAILAVGLLAFWCLAAIWWIES